ncbi:hypothetical protein Tco_1181639, partial [Tanacetum coccineum]
RQVSNCSVEGELTIPSGGELAIPSGGDIAIPSGGELTRRINNYFRRFTSSSGHNNSRQNTKLELLIRLLKELLIRLVNSPPEGIVNSPHEGIVNSPPEGIVNSPPEEKQSSMEDKNPIQPSTSTPVVVELHREALQATSSQISLGSTREKRVYPCSIVNILIAGADHWSICSQELVPQQIGLETALNQVAKSLAHSDAEEIKLDDLSR